MPEFYTPHGIRLMQETDPLHTLDDAFNTSMKRVDDLLTNAMQKEFVNTLRPGDEIVDNFMRGTTSDLGTTLTGQAWTSTGSPSIVNNALQNNPSSGAVCLATVPTVSTNYEITADLTAIGGAGHGVVFGYAGPSNFNMCIIEGTANIRFYQVVNGTTSMVKERSDFAWAQGPNHTFRVVKTNDLLRVTLDGEFLFRADITANSKNRRVGVRLIGNATTPATHRCRYFKSQIR